MSIIKIQRFEIVLVFLSPWAYKFNKSLKCNCSQLQESLAHCLEKVRTCSHVTWRFNRCENQEYPLVKCIERLRISGVQPRTAVSVLWLTLLCLDTFTIPPATYRPVPCWPVMWIWPQRRESTFVRKFWPSPASLEISVSEPVHSCSIIFKYFMIPY